jgi:hypothetical protein
VIAPWRDAAFRAEFPGRAEMIRYCEQRRIPVQATAKKPYSMDRNLLHISFEAGILEDPWLDASAAAHKDMYVLSVAPEDAPDKPESVTLDFERGNCVAVNGKELSPLEVMETLNRLGGKHGIGRVDLVENRFVGMKSRGVYETPGGAILHFAHRQVETITMDREVMHLRDSLIPRYSELVYYGFWFSPERLALQALVTESQKNVTGTVRLKLYKGNIITAGRKSPVSLYPVERIASEGRRPSPREESPPPLTGDVQGGGNGSAAATAAEVRRRESRGFFAEQRRGIGHVRQRKVQSGLGCAVAGLLHLLGDLFDGGIGVVFDRSYADLRPEDDGQEAELIDVDDEHAELVPLLIDAAEVGFRHQTGDALRGGERRGGQGREGRGVELFGVARLRDQETAFIDQQARAGFALLEQLAQTAIQLLNVFLDQLGEGGHIKQLFDCFR